MVFDCRDDYVVHKLLTHWGMTDLDSVIVSHLDWDHIAAVKQLLERDEISTRHVYINVDRDIMDTHADANAAKALVDHVKAGDRRDWILVGAQVQARPIAEGQDWSIEILAPRQAQVVTRERTGKWEDPNTLSVVLRVRMGSNVALIGGDAPLLTWSKIAEPKARVFRVPHHGGALSDGGIPPGWSAKRLYDEVQAETAVVSVGTTNQPKHPSADWVGPACEHGKLMCTQVTPRCHPDVRDDVDNHRSDVIRKGALVEADWWHLEQRCGTGRTNRGVPCAGSVVVTMSSKQLRVRPLPRKHGEVVDLWDHALCKS